MENSTNLRFDLSAAFDEISISAIKNASLSTGVPDAFYDLATLHNKNLISRKTLIGVVDEIFYR